jgi:glycosyltransferase involved in cell wall biosynthesis
MHVLYVNSFLTRPDTEQGTWGRKFADELRAAGVKVTTVPSYGEGEETDSGAASALSFLRIRSLKRYLPTWLVHALIEPFMVVRGLSDTARLWLMARKIDGPLPDVVYGRVMYCDWAPWLIGKSLNRPVVLEIHGPHYFERTFRGRKPSRLLRAFERVQWRRATYIRVACKPVIKLMLDEGVDPDRVRYIPFGVSIMPRPQRALSPPSSATRVVFVGSFYWWHGVDVILRAFARAREDVPNARLELIGDGLTRVDNERLARELGIDDVVRFTGWLPRETVLQKLGESDIAVAPFLELYHYDPAKLLDYMSTGVAIIASSFVRTVDILQGGRGGVLVPPGDVEALAEEIVRVSENPNRRRELGVAAQEILVEDGFTSDAVAEAISRLFNEAVTAERPAGS